MDDIDFIKTIGEGELRAQVVIGRQSLGEDVQVVAGTVDVFGDGVDPGVAVWTRSALG